VNSTELILDSFARIRGLVGHTVGDLTADELAFRPLGTGNSIAWLVWHLTRIQDDHVADVASQGQVWIDAGWDTRFGLPLDPEDTGYAHTARQVAAVQVQSGDLLIRYHEAVYAQTVAYLVTLTEADLERVVDDNWDPPVTLGVRLISVIGDDLQHAGQAAYVKGLLPPAA
jgi:hypothetical protein